MSLGAQGVSLGTRFVASEEAFVPREYKERVVASTAEDCVYGIVFDVGWPDAPHRVLRNKVVAEWEAAGRPPPGKRAGEGRVIGSAPVRGTTDMVDIVRYSVSMPTPRHKVDIEEASLWAGESCSLVSDIKPAAEIVRDLVREAEAVIAGIAANT